MGHWQLQIHPGAEVVVRNAFAHGQDPAQRMAKVASHIEILGSEAGKEQERLEAQQGRQPGLQIVWTSSVGMTQIFKYGVQSNLAHGQRHQNEMVHDGSALMCTL